MEFGSSQDGSTGILWNVERNAYRADIAVYSGNLFYLLVNQSNLDLDFENNKVFQ